MSLFFLYCFGAIRTKIREMFFARFPFVYTKGSWWLGKSQTLLWNGDDKLKKDKIITIRVNEKVKNRLIEKSKIAKLSLSEYLIEQGLDKGIVIVDGLNEVVSELRRIGNNINQLTYLANSGRIYTVDLSEVKQELGKIWNVINELQNKWWKNIRNYKKLFRQNSLKYVDFIVKNWIMWYKINRIIRFNGGNLWKTEI